MYGGHGRGAVQENLATATRLRHQDPRILHHLETYQVRGMWEHELERSAGTPQARRRSQAPGTARPGRCRSRDAHVQMDSDAQERSPTHVRAIVCELPSKKN